MAVSIYDSLHQIPLDELSDKVGGRARLTSLVSKRLRMINDGAQLLVEKREGEALLASVCREIMEDKIWLEVPDTASAAASAAADSMSMLGIGFPDEGGDTEI